MNEESLRAAGYAEAEAMLRDLLTPDLISDTAIRVARDHMMQFVRKRTPLPSEGEPAIGGGLKGCDLCGFVFNYGCGHCHELSGTTPIVGMKPWRGGNNAPGDWDRGPTLLRNGVLAGMKYWPGGWVHRGKHDDIIAYTPVGDEREANRIAHETVAAHYGYINIDNVSRDCAEVVIATKAILAALRPSAEPGQALVKSVAEAIDACGNDGRAGWDWWENEARAAIAVVLAALRPSPTTLWQGEQPVQLNDEFAHFLRQRADDGRAEIDTETRRLLRKIADAVWTQEASVADLREALGKAILFSAYNRNDPLAIRFTFSSDADRVVAANAFDRLLGKTDVRTALRQTQAEGGDEGRGPVIVAKALSDSIIIAEGYRRANQEER